MFSKELEQSISSLFDSAKESRIEYLTVEHLLFMILNDSDVRLLFKELDINVLNFQNNLEAVSYTHLTLPTNREV